METSIQEKQLLALEAFEFDYQENQYYLHFFWHLWPIKLPMQET